MLLRRSLPWLLIPLSLALGASLIKLSQIRTPIGTGPSVLVSMPNGTVIQGKIAGMSIDGSNNIILPTPPLGVPAVAVFHISSTTVNSFPIPAGRTLCWVSNNIPQALNEDYTIIMGAVVFNVPPVTDDIVQLWCF